MNQNHEEYLQEAEEDDTFDSQIDSQQWKLESPNPKTPQRISSQHTLSNDKAKLSVTRGIRFPMIESSPRIQEEEFFVSQHMVGNKRH